MNNKNIDSKDKKSEKVVNFNKNDSNNAFTTKCIDLVKDIESFVNGADLREILGLESKDKLPFTKDQLQEFYGNDDFIDDEEIEVEEKEDQKINNTIELKIIKKDEDFIIDNEFDLLEWYRQVHKEMLLPSKIETSNRTKLSQSKVRNLNYPLKDLECIESKGNYIYITEKGLNTDIEDLKSEQEKGDN